MQLCEIKNYTSKKSKRVVRGRSSGKGKTCGRGTKGQKSRSGHKRLPAFFEGGQMSIVQRLPKQKGFKRKPKIYWEVVNIEKLNLFDSNTKINKKLLLGKKIIKNINSKVKILGKGELTKKILIEADSFSSSALEKIKKAGGTIIKKS